MNKLLLIPTICLALLIVYLVSQSAIDPSQLTTPQVSAQSTNEDWPQLARDAQRSGRNQIGVAPPYNLKWAWFDSSHQVNNFVSEPFKSITDAFPSDFENQVIFADSMQPIIARGKVFVSDMDGMVYALDGLTGNLQWQYQTGGPITATAAYDSGTIVVVSLDGFIYGLAADSGHLTWRHQTNAGISAAPAVQNGTAYVASRDGSLYALNTVTGNLLWRYANQIPGLSSSSPLHQLPILTPPAVSADGSTVIFGAENMRIFALNTQTGQPRWVSAQLVGQTFQYSWPVVVDNKVFIYTVSSFQGSEEQFTPMESLLTSLPDGVSWEQEKQSVLNMLSQNPEQKIFYSLNLSDGNQPYTIAMGRVTGNNDPPFPVVLDHQNQPITYWRSRNATFLGNGPSFGTQFSPDISRINTATGDRVKLYPQSQTNLKPELDNGFALSTAGNYLYMQNHFRGIRVMNMVTGQDSFVTHDFARSDCADFRLWGAQIIYIGNDDLADICEIPDAVADIYNRAGGVSGISIATINGKTMFFSAESMNFIGAFEHKN